MTKAVEIIEEGNPSEAVKVAMKQDGITVDQLEKLLIIEERYKANLAKQAYHKAMTAFKANAPKIFKDQTVAYKDVRYKHAGLYQATEKINAELSKHGLSLSWVPKTNGTISVTTKITHELGHSEEATISAPSDNSGSKNAVQAIGSTITYLQRYGLLALCGLATVDQDDDARAAGEAIIDEKQLSQLRDLLADKEANEAKFCEYLKVESLEKLPASKYQQAFAAISAKKKPGTK